MIIHRCSVQPKLVSWFFFVIFCHSAIRHHLPQPTKSLKIRVAEQKKIMSRTDEIIWQMAEWQMADIAEWQRKITSLWRVEGDAH